VEPVASPELILGDVVDGGGKVAATLVADFDAGANIEVLVACEFNVVDVHIPGGTGIRWHLGGDHQFDNRVSHGLTSSLNRWYSGGSDSGPSWLHRRQCQWFPQQFQNSPERRSQPPSRGRTVRAGPGEFAKSQIVTGDHNQVVVNLVPGVWDVVVEY
jgi:hypothetical protein